MIIAIMIKMRMIIAGAVSALIAAVAAAAAPVMAPALVYNSSPSMPLGFYRRVAVRAGVGAVVTVRARDVAPDYARLRSFDGPRNYFIKRIAAGPGARICASGGAVVVDGVILRRKTHDHLGRALPHWDQCRRLADGEFFLMGETADSFDSRYWGPVDRTAIAGVWSHLP